MAVDYVTFLLDLDPEGGSGVIPGTVAYRRTSAQPENAFMWKVTCDVRAKVIIVAFVGDDLEVIATARWHGKLAEHNQTSATVPTPFQWDLVEKALDTELGRRELVLDRSGEEPVSNAELIEEDVLAVRPTGAPSKEERKRLREAAERNLSPVSDAAEREKGVARIARPWLSPNERSARRHKIALIAGIGTLIAGAVITPIAIVCSAKSDIAADHERERMDREKAASATPYTPAVVAPSTIDAPVVETAEVKIAKAAGLAEAVAVTKADMADTKGDVGRGAWLLAGYAAAKLRWEDVAVEPETTIGHVLKDADVERGKRMCVDGAISEIRRRDLEQRKVYVGRLDAADGDAVVFVAVGTTGDLVRRSKSRFCGVVIGQAEGAVSMVGMFDLPENRSPVVEQ